LSHVLHHKVDYVRPLAELTLRKTNGSPLFLVQLLASLCEKNLLRFALQTFNSRLSDIPDQVQTVYPDSEQSMDSDPTDDDVLLSSCQGQWEWDIQEISHVGVSNNVVSLMVDKIAKMTLMHQQVLRMASCIGVSFEVEVLFSVCALSGIAITDAIDSLQAALLRVSSSPFQIPISCRK